MNGTRLEGGGQLLDMELQECQYILVIFVSYLHICLSAMVYVKHHFKMKKIHNTFCKAPSEIHRQSTGTTHNQPHQQLRS